MNLHEEIDRFVEIAIKHGAQITQTGTAPWVRELEEKLARGFPASFNSLVSRYVFAPFEIGELAFFGNTGSQRDNEMAVTIFKDAVLAEVTQSRGYVQFARLTDGSYDPICFDTNQKAKNREYPIVQISHEQVLCNDRIGKPMLRTKSFHQFVRAVIENERS